MYRAKEMIKNLEEKINKLKEKICRLQGMNYDSTINNCDVNKTTTLIQSGRIRYVSKYRK
jgi:hypothetical protein